MSLQDKAIRCSDCGVTFTFTSGEQEFFRSKGFADEPKRCSACRAKRKTQRQGDSSRTFTNRY